MTVSHSQIEGIIDEAIRQQTFYLNPVLSGVGRYEQELDDAIDDLESKLPSALKLDSSGYTIDGTTVKLQADLGGKGHYNITTARTGAAEYHGVEFEISGVELNGTIELSDDPRESDNVSIVDSDVSYTIRGSADPY